jgi:hypothetical protein
MAEAASDYHHGDQPAEDHLRTYHFFLNMAKWAALHLAVLILVLTLWFCAGASFLGGLVPGAIVAVLGGWWLLAKPLAAEH